jgi:hypothetical protein
MHAYAHIFIYYHPKRSIFPGIASHPFYKNFVLEICNPNNHDVND